MVKFSVIRRFIWCTLKSMPLWSTITHDQNNHCSHGWRLSEVWKPEPNGARGLYLGAPGGEIPPGDSTLLSIWNRALNGRYRRHSGHWSELALNGSVANDPH